MCTGASLFHLLQRHQTARTRTGPAILVPLRSARTAINTFNKRYHLRSNERAEAIVPQILHNSHKKPSSKRLKVAANE